MHKDNKKRCNFNYKRKEHKNEKKYEKNLSIYQYIIISQIEL